MSQAKGSDISKGGYPPPSPPSPPKPFEEGYKPQPPPPPPKPQPTPQQPVEAPKKA